MAALVYAPTRAAAAGAQTWLVVSDVHLDLFDRHTHPSLFGSDTNLTLFRSALAEMRRRVPDPAAVLLPGDFFAHDLARRARRGGGYAGDAAGVETMRFIAGEFARAYPHARFAVVLGNNDAPCGDYHVSFGTRFAYAIARIWEPLVNRGGAAPAFAASFAANGSYAADSPLPGTRFVVVDDVPLSTMYRGNCAIGAQTALEAQLEWLRATLASTPAGTTNVVLMHIPPGYDAFSTERARGFFPWPFLEAGANDALLSVLSNGANRIAFVAAGHEHRFDFRIVGGVPLVVFGSLSPIYHNNPAFYALDVDAGGRPRDVRAFAFDEWTQSWQPSRSFDGKWHTAALDAASLRRLHARLGKDAALRHAWDAATSGWPSNWNLAWGMWGNSWRIPWCAQVYLDGGFTACAGLSARAELFRAALAAIAVCFGLSIAGLALLPARAPRETRDPGSNER
jgi:hypothetical protein